MKKPLVLLSIFFLNVPSIISQTIKPGIITDIDGNTYRTVIIGNYEWMAENLRTTRFSNDEKISYCTEDSIWSGLSSSAYCWYNNDMQNERIYGALYNWYAVDKGLLCPVGWRVPTDNEWNYLSGFADTEFKVNAGVWQASGLVGFDAGRRLKSLTGWIKEGNGSDNLGFSALPGGERSSKDGHFHLAGYNGYWWSFSEAGVLVAWYRSIIYSIDNISRDTHGKGCGFSVRCIRDVIPGK